jgi:hypothetical protein
MESTSNLRLVIQRGRGCYPTQQSQSTEARSTEWVVEPGRMCRTSGSHSGWEGMGGSGSVEIPGHLQSCFPLSLAKEPEKHFAEEGYGPGAN